eukprot:4566351-Pyramimonas_sp.AAC.2
MGGLTVKDLSDPGRLRGLELPVLGERVGDVSPPVGCLPAGGEGLFCIVRSTPPHRGHVCQRVSECYTSSNTQLPGIHIKQ